MPGERDDTQAAEFAPHRARTSQSDAPTSAPGRARPRFRPAVLAVIAVGGALGTSARYCVAQLVPPLPGSFPWATFWTNVSGSLALGAVSVMVAERFPPSRLLRPFLATGFLGAYTTYSMFGVETDVLAKDGHSATAAAYVAASLVGGLVAVWLGMLVARLLPLRGKGGRL